MRRSYMLAATALGLLAMVGCKPSGASSEKSVMDGVGGNEIATNGPAVAPPSMDPVANLKAAEAFLATNKTANGVQTTASGLQYAVIASGAGDGPKPSETSVVQVNYEGKLLSGQVFDSSFARGQAAEFTVGQLIPAWIEALQMMRPGDEWTIWVPPAIGYGAAGAGDSIPPNSLLVFRMRLEKIAGGPNSGVGMKPDQGATK